MGFRSVLVVTLVLALGWSGYWWVGASQTRAQIEGWLSDRQSEGWVAEVNDLSISGFPNRFDSVFDGLFLADPSAGWSWDADAFNILSLSYRPDHLILTFPGIQRIGTPEGRGTVQGDILRASVEATSSGLLERIILEGSDVAVETETGSAVIGVLAVASQEVGAAQVQRVGFTIENMALDQVARDGLDPTGLLPATVDRLHLDATVRLAEPLTTRFIEELPVANDISLRDASLRWGEVDFRARGELTRGPGDLAEGEIDVRIRDWERIVRAAEASGQLQPEVAGAVEFGLNLLARLSGDDEAIEATIVMRDGIARVGPFTLGTAPSMRIGQHGSTP